MTAANKVAKVRQRLRAPMLCLDGIKMTLLPDLPAEFE